MVNARKKLNGASFGADFQPDENIDYTEEKELKIDTLNGATFMVKFGF